MMEVSPLQLIGLWEELMACVYDANGYGGTTAEIYLYTVMPYAPAVVHNPESKRAIEEYAKANKVLYDLCRLFEERNSVKLRLEGEDSLDELIRDPKEPFTHRVRIEVYEGVRR